MGKDTEFQITRPTLKSEFSTYSLCDVWQSGPQIQALVNKYKMALMILCQLKVRYSEHLLPHLIILRGIQK